GVSVCLKAPVHDTYSGADFAAGTQTLSGTQALAFVRQRHGLPNGDLDRIARQQAFISSMAKTVLGAGTLTDPSKLSNLVTAVQGAVVLDKGWDILSFAEQVRGLSSGTFGFVTIPIQALSLKTPSDGDAVKVDPAQVRDFVRNALGSSVSAASSGTPKGKIRPVAETSTPASGTATPPPPTSPDQPVTTASGCVN
ncbi:LCP family protein, partial [Amycolatopsis sp. H20-H5]|uniref:LCP family protein n=1 Tax=Amycolatopsis sp. H20-H5 TaxID=3046309 RepID=UPI002DB9744A